MELRQLLHSDSWKVVGFALVAVRVVIAVIAADLVLTLVDVAWVVVVVVGYVVVHPMEANFVLHLFALLLGHSPELDRVT